MKKVLVGITGLAMLAFVVVLMVSARSQDEDIQKTVSATVETTACGSSSACMGNAEAAGSGCSMTANATMECAHEKCTDCTCEPGKCDGNCSENCTGSCEDCSETCENSASESCDMANCNK